MDNNCINKNICIELELNTPHIEIELEMGAKGKDGKDATINGINTLNVVAGNNISLEQEGSTLTITGTYEYDDTGIKNDINEINESLKNYALKEDVPTKVSQLENDLKYVNNTDYATSTVAGVIKTNAGLDVDENGMVVADTYNYDEYKSKTDNNFISKGTLENVITGKNLETANNKVTSLGTGSTDIEYPSAKCTYKIKEDVDNLKSDILETGTASDSFINVQDSAWAEMQELSVDGVCEQETTTGKNLLNVSKTIENSNGIKTTYNEDGSITITGIPTIEWADLTERNNNKLTTGNYVFSVTEKKTYNIIIRIYYTDNTSQDFAIVNNHLNTKFTLTKEAVTYRIFVNNLVIGKKHNDTLYLQFEKGSTETSWEPYTGGQPSPSPDYPQEIKTITDSLSVTSCNKNLFNKTKILVGYRLGSDGLPFLDTSYFASEFIKVKPNTTYICSAPRDLGGSQCICLYDKEFNFIVREFMQARPNYKITTGDNAHYIRIADINERLDDTQLEENTQATPFEQHLQTQITANLPEGEFIGKINDTYKDTLKVEYNEEDGQYQLILNKYIGKTVLDGSENITKNSMINTGFTIPYNATSPFYNKIKLEVGLGISNYFINQGNTVTWSGKGKFGFNTGGAFWVMHTDDAINTIDKFKTWLSTHNVEVYYVLANPYTVDLGVVDMPLSYNEVTNIFTDSDLLPQINAKYYRNFISTIRNLQVNNDTLKNELVSIENRLAELEKAKENVTNNEEVSI